MRATTWLGFAVGYSRLILAGLERKIMAFAVAVEQGHPTLARGRVTIAQGLGQWDGLAKACVASQCSADHGVLQFEVHNVRRCRGPPATAAEPGEPEGRWV